MEGLWRENNFDMQVYWQEQVNTELFDKTTVTQTANTSYMYIQ